MPDAGKQPYDQRGDDGHQRLYGTLSETLAHQVAKLDQLGGDGQGHHHIVLEPGAQRNVPSAPILGNIFCKIRCLQNSKRSTIQTYFFLRCVRKVRF